MLWLTWLCLLFIPGIVLAQEAPPTPGPGEVAPAETLSVGAVQAAIEALGAETQLADDVKVQAQTIYQSAIGHLEDAQASRETARQHQDTLASAEATTAQLQHQAWNAAATSVVRDLLPAGPSLAEIEQALDAAQGRAAGLRSTLAELNAKLEALDTGVVPLREALADERQELLDLQPGAGGEGSDELQPAVRQATAMAGEAERAARRARIAALESELASLPARQDILTARIGLAQVQLIKLEGAIQTLADRASARRRAEAAQQLAASEREAAEQARSHPMLSDYAQKTADESRTLNETVGQIESLDEAQVLAMARVALFEQTRESLNEVMAIGASGEDFAELLRELRSDLPETASIRRAITSRGEDAINTRLQRLRIQDRLRRLADPSNASQVLIADWIAKHPESPRITSAIEAELRVLMESRRAVLAKMEAAYDTYLTRLTLLNETDQELVDGAEALSDTLEKRLLWMPSAAPIGPLWIERIRAGLSWITAPEGWRESGRTLATRVLQQPVPTSLVVVLVLTLLVVHRRLIAELKKIADAVRRVWGDSFWLTIKALLVTLLLALPFSLMLVWLGVLLYSSNGGLFASALGGGLINAGVVLFILRVFQAMCKKSGLFAVHFRWSDQARSVLSHNLRWLILAILPAAIVIPMTELSGDIYYQNGLGRLLFLTASLAMSVFLYRVLHPKRGTASAGLRPAGVAWRTRLIWFPLLAVAPILLGIAAAIGYYETALKIQGQLFTSAWVFLVGLIAYSLAMRWVVVAHRRLAVSRAREQREKKLAAEAATAAASGTTGEPTPTTIDTPEIDLSSVSTQTRSLLRAIIAAGYLFLFYLIWDDLIPALGVLDEVSLWSSTVKTPDGVEVSAITLWGLIVAMVITSLTVIAARNLPGVLEITVLQRLSIDAGTRYAVTAICRYLILALGLFIAFNSIGVGWGKMQFVVAALGVGLGFGLQEIVANFVSGIIILFERPIRVGDAVTVNDLSGTVARIQIRATTIFDWDNREILVPNKSFITGNVINWTLTDPVTRMVIHLGIAYGTDTKQAYDILNEVLKSNPDVLKTPEPSVYFVGIGACSYDYDVRFYVKDTQHRLPVRHEVLVAIEKAFGDAGIEMPFPQQDLHLRSSDIPLPSGYPPGPDAAAPERP